MEPFKNLLNDALARSIGQHIVRVWPAFDRVRFEVLALGGLETLELKARVRHVCAALVATLPTDFSAAADVIEASLGATVALDEPSGRREADDGLTGWAVWPLAEFVAERGLDAPERALAALHAITQRFTSEWPIRAFIERHPALAFATLKTWAGDDSAHVRRLVSEGSRPRLPWGLQLKGLIADPTPTLPLLLALQDDPSAYVRRSVANHLNDIAKDHPARVALWVETHLPGASPERLALLRHASRTLIKRGDARILKAWGLGGKLRGSVALSLTPTRLTVGESLVFEVDLCATSAKPQKLAIDYAVHHVKASGTSSAKVFKGWVVELGPHETRQLRKTHSMRLITTRRYHAGRHTLDLRVNGEVLASADFDLEL